MYRNAPGPHCYTAASCSVHDVSVCFMRFRWSDHGCLKTGLRNALVPRIMPLVMPLMPCIKPFQAVSSHAPPNSSKLNEELGLLVGRCQGLNHLLTLHNSEHLRAFFLISKRQSMAERQLSHGQSCDKAAQAPTK